MAKDNKKNEETTTAGADEAGLAKKAKRKKLLLIVGLVILLVVVSVGSTLALVKLFADPVPEVSAEGGEEASAGEPVVEAKKPAIYYPMQPVFVVNFISEGRQRFLQAELNLLLREQDVIPVLELHMPAIRNSLVMLFSGQLYEDLQTAEGKELLRQQALLSVQDVLQKEIGKPGVEQVLFTNFVMQ